MDYLNPFLDVILSPETSGPVTGVALTSVLRMLEHYVLGELSVLACASYITWELAVQQPAAPTTVIWAAGLCHPWHTLD